jgi:ATP-binding cassette subfamily B protein
MKLRRSRERDEQSSRSSTRERLGALLGDRRRTIAVLAGCSVASGLAEAGILALVAQIVATASNGSGHGAKSGVFHLHASIGVLFAIAAGLVLFRAALQWPLSVLPARIASNVQARMRTRLFAAFSKASWAIQSADREGYLQEIMTGQVMQATVGAMQATNLLIASLTFIVLLVSAFALNAVAAVVVLAAAALIFWLLRPLNVLGASRAKELSRAQLAYAGGISEASRLAEESQVYGTGAAQRAHIGKFIGTAEALFYRAQIIVRLAPSLYSSAIYLILVGGLAALYSEGTQHFVSLSAVILLVMRAGTYGQALQGSYQSLRQCLPFIERVQDAERRYVESTPVDGGAPLPAVRTLAFEGISFAYNPGRPVLSEVGFTVDAGETIGIVGPSGAGKSTLIQILLQLRAPEEGRYLVNGVPVTEFAREDWHRQVSYVPQEPRLVHTSVAENIRYFRPLDDEQVERAARLARIHDDIISWPDGYETIVGPRADAVSGGQQQRICLARALAAQPQVLVLDEPTSALDPKSETLIQESLASLKQELTLFIVAHRMSTLDICDRVMVIVGGRLVAFDTKAVLEEHNPYYRSASILAAGAAGGTLP